MKNPCVYILASRRNGTLYVGVTSHIVKRVWEHKNKSIEGFTAKYQVDKLVYYEHFDNMTNAIKREKRLKEWPRKWKLALIEKTNPSWLDLYEAII
ncbi:MAG: GIY-YIG nuclease family protein [Deltaproteobacteria bacterium]|nr:GIY-YIG nuclease family protein [Deltaproteobacteria bacterium]